eukprot:3619502-Rhodomonas_salina.1
MLSTLLNPKIASAQILEDGWTVETVLNSIATADPPYHAMIDTGELILSFASFARVVCGALVIGYSNQEVAAYLLEHGLQRSFEGVVFLDENDEKQVWVRATKKAVPIDQCGVSMERRFAFYDQIHTTGTDIKHVRFVHWRAISALFLLFSTPSFAARLSTRVP